MKRSRIVLLTVTLLAAVYGIGLYAQENWAPAGCCGLTWPTVNPSQADRLAALADPKWADPTVQRATALAELSARPMDSDAWLRLAYADRLAHGGRYGPEGRKAMETSYLVLPYARPKNAEYRVYAALDSWSQLTPQTKEDAMREIVLLKANPDSAETVAQLRKEAPSLTDVQGRIVALLF